MKKLNITTLSTLSILLVLPLVYGEEQVPTSEKVHTETNFEKDPSGIKRVVVTDKVNDPEGLGNKTWSKEKEETLVNEKGELTKKVTNQGLMADGTAQLAEKVIKEDKLADGTFVTKTTEKVVTDPKGLMNKTGSESETTIITHPDGSIDTKVKIEQK